MAGYFAPAAKEGQERVFLPLLPLSGHPSRERAREWRLPKSEYNLLKIGNRFVYPFKDTPKGFLECFQVQPKTCTRAGQKTNLLIPPCKNKTMEKLCTYQVPYIYNSLNNTPKKHFKQSIPQAFFDNCIDNYNNFICHRNNCYACKQKFK